MTQKQNTGTLQLVEMLGGFFGFAGLGYIMAGRTNDGIVRLLGWFALLVMGWSLVGVLSAIGIGCLLVPFMVLAQIGLPIWSGVALRNSLVAEE